MMIYLINQETLLCLRCFYRLKVSVCTFVNIGPVYVVSIQYKHLHSSTMEKCEKTRNNSNTITSYSKNKRLQYLVDYSPPEKYPNTLIFPCCHLLHLLNERIACAN